MKASTQPTASIPFEKLGPAGIRGELHALAITEGEKRSDRERLHDSSPRKFRVFGRLGKQPLVQDGIKGDFIAEDGSSFLLTPPDVEITRVQCPDGVFEFEKNSVGEHALVRFECEATSTKEGRHKFVSAVFPFLDFISYHANCPLYLTTIRVDDIKNLNTVIEYIAPHQKATINPHTSNLLPELQPVFAMYREAKNSNSDFYKFLCYHKLLEGLFGAMRSGLFQRAKAKGLMLQKRRDVIPSSIDLAGPYKSYAGKPIKEFFDNVLTPKFRNAVAHFITDDGSVLNMSSPAHIDSYAEVLYVTEVCVREVVKNYEAMVFELHSKT